MMFISELRNQRKLNILYVGNFSPNSVGEPEIAWALEKLGHRVDKLDETPTALGEVYKRLAKRNEYNLLLFAKFRVSKNPADIREFLTRTAKTLKVPTVCWLFDLYWGYRREAEIKINMLPAFSADIVFTTDGGHDHMWKRYGINHFLLRQGTDERIEMSKIPYPTQAEIGFVGSRHTWAGWPYRGQLIDFLEQSYGKRFWHFGQNGDVRHEKLNSLLTTLKITICDSVESPNYWSNRIYETIGRGGFAIHSRIEGLATEFKEFEHFIPYKIGNFKDLKQKIDYYLENDEERERIREAGFNYCHKVHTYTERCKQLIKVLEEQKII